MKWLRDAGIALGVGLLGLGLYMLGRPSREREAAEAREIDYLAHQVKGNTEKARKQALKAEVHKREAEQAAEAHIKVMENVRTKDTQDIIALWTN